MVPCEPWSVGTSLNAMVTLRLPVPNSVPVLCDSKYSPLLHFPSDFSEMLLCIMLSSSINRTLSCLDSVFYFFCRDPDEWVFLLRKIRFVFCYWSWIAEFQRHPCSRQWTIQEALNVGVSENPSVTYMSTYGRKMLYDIFMLWQLLENNSAILI